MGKARCDHVKATLLVVPEIGSRLQQAELNLNMLSLRCEWCKVPVPQTKKNAWSSGPIRVEVSSRLIVLSMSMSRSCKWSETPFWQVPPTIRPETKSAKTASRARRYSTTGGDNWRRATIAVPPTMRLYLPWLTRCSKTWASDAILNLEDSVYFVDIVEVVRSKMVEPFPISIITGRKGKKRREGEKEKRRKGEKEKRR